MTRATSPPTSRALRWSRRNLDSLEFSIALAKGDTAGALAVAREHVPINDRITLEEAELLLPYLDDPERLWRLGVPVRYSYSELTRTLLRA